MAKNKKKGKQAEPNADDTPQAQAQAQAQAQPSQAQASTSTSGASNDNGAGSSATASSTLASKPKDSSASAQPPSSPALVICRNKHWRHISSFHGPWLNLPPELLETLAHINYNTPLPHPIDPAVFYDVLKIRRLVDDSTDLAVRAANGLVSRPGLDNSHNANALGLSCNPANQLKLSAKTRNKLREQATAKLARAYRLDEVASSVATMQAASSLENVASLVLKRDSTNLDAKYVHFFHEKIPSRHLAESTSLDVLDDIIANQSPQCEPLRTRATVSVFKEDYKGAAEDLSTALTELKIRSRHNRPPEDSSTELQLQVSAKGSRRVDIKPDEDHQPSSMEAQLLFARANAYLSIACLSVNKSLEPLPSPLSGEPQDSGSAGYQPSTNQSQHDQGTETEKDTPTSTPVADAPPSMLSAEDKATTAQILDARKVVKTNARKALYDYMAFLAHYHYSPNLPVDVADDFTKRVGSARNKGRSAANRIESPSGDGNHKVYSLNELFFAVPPTDIPPYPPTDMTVASLAPDESVYVGSTMETVTYHPLLTDALHALLLTHVLVQTSTKELQRHAYMVARIARIADAYPIFQGSRSPARADWIEVLRQGNNWVGLISPWEVLCSPISLEPAKDRTNEALLAPKDSERQKTAIHQEAMRRAFTDERVSDEDMLRVAYQAHKKHVEEDIKTEHEMFSDKGKSSAMVPVSTNEGASSSTSKPKPAAIDTTVTNLTPPSDGSVSPGAAHRRWAMDEGREYPILTERASAVARWQRDAPPRAGATGRPKKKKKANAKA